MLSLLLIDLACLASYAVNDNTSATIVPNMLAKQKVYCFIDETGQDAGSDIFIVAAVITWEDVEAIRFGISRLEQVQKIGSKKWHKLRHVSRMQFMSAFLRERYSGMRVFYGRFPKPIPAFFPTLDVIQKSLTEFSHTAQLVVGIDGLDVVSARKMTNALRTKHRHVRLVRGPKDESEVLIRLADRWAGLLRSAFVEGSIDSMELVTQAQKMGLLREV